MLTLSSSQFDPMYGPAVRCKRFVDLVVSGLASMYPVSSWSCCAPDHHGYQRACDLINGQASIGAIWVTSVRMRREDRSSISTYPLADLGWKLLIGLRHRLLLICAVPLFDPRAVPSSRPVE